MKLDKRIVARRVSLLQDEGIRFETRTHVGAEEDFPTGHMSQIMQHHDGPLRYVDPQRLIDEHDAVLFAVGATRPRDLPIPGRELDGIHFAMEFLTRNTKSCSTATCRTERSFPPKIVM